MTIPWVIVSSLPCLSEKTIHSIIVTVKTYLTKKFCKRTKKTFKTQNQLAVEILQELTTPPGNLCNGSCRFCFFGRFCGWRNPSPSHMVFREFPWFKSENHRQEIYQSCNWLWKKALARPSNGVHCMQWTEKHITHDVNRGRVIKSWQNHCSSFSPWLSNNHSCRCWQKAFFERNLHCVSLAMANRDHG